MASLLFLLLFGGILSSFQAILVSSDSTGSCGNQVTLAKKLSKPDTPCGNNYAYQGYCVNKCPIGFYPKSGKCLSCHGICSSCYETQCLSCKDTNYLSQRGLCVKTCDAKMLMKNSSSPRVRLVEGRSSLEGVVEVYYKGSWGTICADGWSAGEVLCKELKLGHIVEAKIVGQNRFKRSDGYKDMKIWLSGVNCKGHEKSILDCKHKAWGDNQCSHLEDVGIRCSGPDATNTCETSCSDGYFASNGKCLECPLDCKVCTSLDNCSSCNEMRFLEGTFCVPKCKPGNFGNLETRKCLPCPDQCETCIGTDNTPRCTSCSSDKQANFINGDQCMSQCPGEAVGFSKYVRLSGNHSSPYMGLLEVKYKGEWHTVCDDGFDLDTARVFCRELGYGQPIRYQGSAYGKGTGKIIAQYINCKGDEKSFIECPQVNWFSRGCYHYEDVGLRCEPPAENYVVKDGCIEKCPRGTFPNKEKICELCNRKCKTCLEHPENCLSCREPFFHNGTTCARICPDGTFPNATLRVCLPCNKDCRTCKDQADKCLSCVPPLLHNGTSCGLTCPDKIYRKEYLCVKDCGLRHYPKDKVCHVCPLKCLVCTSSTKCKACEHGFVLTKKGKCERNCPTDQYWAYHEPKSLGIALPLRLSSVEDFKYKGRLEIKHEGVWGSICDDGWSGKNAEVVCKQLLLGPPVKNVYLNYKSFKELKEFNVTKIWLDDVDCKGTEDDLAQCKSIGWGSHNCVHSEDVHIECAYPGISSCETECPPSYYKNGTRCQPCYFNCLNCSGTANNCSLCREGYFRTNGSICVKECPPGFYKTDNRHCKPCHPDCWTCSGPAITECTSCKRPSMLLGDMCLKSCSVDYIERGVNPYIKLWKKVGPYEGVVLVKVKGISGFVCNRYLRLGDGHVVCKELQMGKAVQVYDTEMYSYYRTPLLIKNTGCTGNESSIFNCPIRRYAYYCSRRSIMSVKCSGPDMSSRCLRKSECPTKKNFYITEDNKVCNFCSKNCLRCEKNATRCTACPKGFLLTWDNKCVQYCREGTFYDSYSNRCTKCSTKCVACANNKDVCTVCPASKPYLASIACLENCNNYRLTRHGSAQLRLVPDRTGSIVQGNSSRGLVEMFINTTHWFPVCAVNWNIQAGAVACHELGYGDPIQVFPVYKYTSSFTLERTLKLNCTGKETRLKDCPRISGSCPSFRIGGVVCTRSTPKKVCDESCKPGFYQYKTECRACFDCTTCVGTASTCTSCNNTYVLHESKCLEKCPDGYFIHLQKKRCMRCSDMCKTCLDGFSNGRCSSCDKPYFLRGSTCVGTCYPDHTLEDLMSGETPSGNIRLVNGSNDREGFIQMRTKSQNNYKWGIICNTNQVITTLVCQELGFQSGSLVRYNRLYSFARVPIFQVSCNGYEKYLTDCNMYPTYYCARPFIACSNKPLDKRVCRKENTIPCASGVCFSYPSVSCANGDGKVVPKGRSYCKHCPPNYYGDGVNCQAISKVAPSVRQTYIEHQLRLRATYYFPCFGRSGTLYIYPNRKSWFKDEKNVDVSSGRFRLGPVQYEDAGIYKCLLGNSMGSVTITFNITIVGPPMIKRADNIDAVHGDSVMLNCEVLAHPPATITWHFGNTNFSENSTRDGGPRVVNGSLYIPQTIAKDAGTYKCIAVNVRGRKSENITLRIGEEARFEKKANSLSVAIGGKAVFSCRPLSTDGEMSIKWRRNGQTIQSGGKYDVGSESLTISDVSSKDCGEYYCVARDGHSIITSIGTLAIKNEKPCIHKPPEHLQLDVGMYARFYCAASGDPTPEILWQNAKQPNPNVFEIEKVNISHVGVYTCTARSKDKVSNAYAFLTVDNHYPCPFIFKKPKNTQATFGGSATFYCYGVTLNEQHITWSKGNHILTASKKYKILDNNRQLVINNVNEDDIGEYRCKISDVHGDTSATAFLTTVNLGSQHGGSSSPNTAGIVVGVLLCILVILIILYFVHRYHRHGATPADVIKDVKRKTFSRFQSPTHHTVLKYDTSEYNDDEDEVYDTSDTNPFVRD